MPQPTYPLPITEICQQIQFRFERIPYPWQITAMEKICQGKDLIVLAPTGRGKSLIFQGMIFSRPGAIVLVISPLKAIMTEQVISNLVKCLMQAETINAILRTSQPDLTAGPQRDIAVALTAETVEHDPHLWKKVKRCEFQLVYASTEILLRPTSYFFKNILKNLNHPFLTNLVTIALDECHTLLHSGTYRPACRLLKNLRDLLCDVSFTAFSASMTPLDIIQLRASMSLDDAVLIQQSIQKGNLKIWVAQLCHKGLYTDLDVLVPKQLQTAKDIPQTLI